MSLDNESTIDPADESLEISGNDSLREMNADLERAAVLLTVNRETAHSLETRPNPKEYPLEKRKEEIVRIVRQLLRSEPDWENSSISFVTPPAHIDAHLSLQIRPEGNQKKDSDKLDVFRKRLAPMLVSQLPMMLGFPVELKQEGIFLNIKMDEDPLSQEILSNVTDKADRFGDSDRLRNKRIVVDYSSPNIAKTMHVGHLRSTIIGASLVRLLQSQGAITYGVNHLGDWGTQFGQLVTAYKLWADEVSATINPEQNPVGFLAELYRRIKQAIKQEEGQPEKPLTEEGRANFALLEKGEPEVVKLWNEFRRLSLIEFKRLYDRLGIEFDAYLGESFYEDKMVEPVEDAINQGIAEKDEKGAIVVGKRDGLPSTLLRKTDGTSNYVTRDVAALRTRRNLFRATEILYVVGAEQKDHFRQCFDISERIGDTPKGTAEHIAFGMITKEGKKVASREGASGLSDLLDELRDRSLQDLNKRYPDEDPESLLQSAEAIGKSALVYRNFMQHRERNMDFDGDEMLNMNVQSGPYLLYTHRRIQGLLEQIGQIDKIDSETELSVIRALPKEIKDLILQIGKLPEILEKTTDTRGLHVLATYLYGVCSQFNTYYAQGKKTGRVMDMNPEQKAVYSKAFQALQIVLQKGFSILNMEIPKKM